jgi:hypothetical protein
VHPQNAGPPVYSAHRPFNPASAQSASLVHIPKPPLLPLLPPMAHVPGGAGAEHWLSSGR